MDGLRGLFQSWWFYVSKKLSVNLTWEQGFCRHIKPHTHPYLNKWQCISIPLCFCKKERKLGTYGERGLQPRLQSAWTVAMHTDSCQSWHGWRASLEPMLVQTHVPEVMSPILSIHLLNNNEVFLSISSLDRESNLAHAILQPKKTNKQISHFCIRICP